MAEPKFVPSVKLSPQQVIELEGSKVTIQNARRELEILKKLGMDVKMIEDKLEWADEVQNVLLKEFSG